MLYTRHAKTLTDSIEYPPLCFQYYIIVHIMSNDKNVNERNRGPVPNHQHQHKQLRTHVHHWPSPICMIKGREAKTLTICKCNDIIPTLLINPLLKVNIDIICFDYYFLLQSHQSSTLIKIHHELP